MKSDLDRLMQENDIAALLVTGAGQHNPAMYYLTGGAPLTHADLIKPRGAAPVLFHGTMERDEAAKSGLPLKNLSDYNYKELLQKANGDRILASALRYQQMLADNGITSGRVALYGKTELNEAFSIFTRLQKIAPDLELIGEAPGNSILLQAMATKDETEIARIRHMGKVTTEVVGLTAEFLSSHPAKNGKLTKADGNPLTIGDVKRQINFWLAERGAEAPEGFIFAQGRDAGVPHSQGNPDEALETGKTIIFDIFPCEAGGGYYYDFTRTWSLGYAPDGVESLYDDVRSTYDTIMGDIKLNAAGSQYQEKVCDMFEALGHKTIRGDLTLQEGYIHSLGHGLGLHVHEAPSFRNKEYASDKDVLFPGAVITVEPGLYYPSKGMGVRLEDTVWVRPDGVMEILAEYPLDLVIPVKG
ncbi:MAG TPA: M24 family metallopeptidase [Anaerolineales bacterium]|nr:M24 family metallopeptidase [Anaerolineales bacterium]